MFYTSQPHHDRVVDLLQEWSGTPHSVSPVLCSPQSLLVLSPLAKAIYHVLRPLGAQQRHQSHAEPWKASAALIRCTEHSEDKVGTGQPRQGHGVLLPFPPPAWTSGQSYSDPPLPNLHPGTLSLRVTLCIEPIQKSLGLKFKPRSKLEGCFCKFQIKHKICQGS